MRTIPGLAHQKRVPRWDTRSDGRPGSPPQRPAPRRPILRTLAYHVLIGILRGYRMNFTPAELRPAPLQRAASKPSLSLTFRFLAFSLLVALPFLWTACSGKDVKAADAKRRGNQA